jgi:hypothetical protein
MDAVDTQASLQSSKVTTRAAPARCLGRTQLG